MCIRDSAKNEEEIYILTEYRGVEQVDRIQVVFCDGSMVDARYQKHDPNTGLAILKVPVSSLSSQTREQIQVAEFGNSNTIRQGEPIMALGLSLIHIYGPGLVRELERAGIPAAVVGRTTAGKDRIVRNGEDVQYLTRPQIDELYKVMG